jgi:GT2 family glycosyltransferase
VSGIDVIVPCYNYGHFLNRCVGSVLAQPGCTVRVLIIDDASPDGSAAEAQRLAAADPRVECRVHARNQGHIATYNEGIEWIAADYMLLLSADDVLAPGALGRAAALMDADPAIAFVYGDAMAFSDERSIAAQLASPPAATLPTRRRRGAEFIRALCEKPANPIDTATAVVRTSVQKRAGGYRPELPHSGDYEMWLRLALYGDVGEVQGLQAFTRIHAKNMRHQYSADRLMGDYAQRHQALVTFFAAAVGRLAEATELRRIALRRLAEEVLWAATRALEEGNRTDTDRLAALARSIDQGVMLSRTGLGFAAKRAIGPTWLRRLQHLRGPPRAAPSDPRPERSEAAQER